MTLTAPPLIGRSDPVTVVATARIRLFRRAEAIKTRTRGRALTEVSGQALAQWHLLQITSPTRQRRILGENSLSLALADASGW